MNWEFIFYSSISGGLSGIITDIVVFPIDTIKTYRQSLNPNSKIFKNIKYSGIFCNFIASFPGSAGFWLGYDFSRSLIRTYFHGQSTLISDAMIGSICGEVLTTLCRNPFELVKQNMQLKYFKTTFEGFCQIYKKRGIPGFYRGWNNLILREIPFAIIEMPLYESLKHYNFFLRLLHKFFNNTPINKSYILFQNSINGGIAGLISGFLTTPLDVLKTRKMTQSFDDKSHSSFKLLKYLLREAGLKGLWKGGLLRSFHLGFGGVIYFSVYEFFLSKFQVRSFVS